MDKMEEAVRRKRKQVTRKELEAEFMQWVPNSGFSRTRDTKIFLLVELYILDEQGIHCPVVEEKATKQEAILHKLNIMDQKFNAL